MPPESGGRIMRRRWRPALSKYSHARGTAGVTYCWCGLLPFFCGVRQPASPGQPSTRTASQCLNGEFCDRGRRRHHFYCAEHGIYLGTVDIKIGYRQKCAGKALCTFTFKSQQGQESFVLWFASFHPPASAFSELLRVENDPGCYFTMLLRQNFAS